MAGAMARPKAAVAIVEIASRRETGGADGGWDGRRRTADGGWDGGWQTAVCLGIGRMYAELHCHSTFSLLDGAAHPEQLVARAVQLGMPALALTDRDDLGGAVRFSTAAATAGLNAIIGVELTLEMTADGGRQTMAGTADDGRQLHAAIRRLSSQPPSTVRRLPSNHSQIVLLAENREGYGNLSTLITRARLDHPRGVPRVSLDTLARHTNGLFALTGSPRGGVAQLAARGEHDAACEEAAALVDIFDRRVAIECWDHSLPEERATTTAL